MKYNYQAIALEKINIGEADRLYTFYTLESGLMRIPARSVRKSKSKMAAQVEDFVFSNITIAKNYGNGILAGAIVERYFVSLHKNYDAILCADKVRNIFLSIIDENYKDDRIFSLFVEYLHLLNNISKKDDYCKLQLNWITHSFLIKLFSLLGYDFYTKKCCVCDKKITETQNGFSIERGGILCNSCFCNEYFCFISPDTLKAIRIIQNNNLTALLKINVNNDVDKQLERIIFNTEKWIMR